VKTAWIPAVVAGAGIGAVALVLWKFGNPGNMGFCTACFERDIAGALGLHSAPPVRVLRLEILGVVLGASVLALARGEFKAKAGSAPLTHFVGGAFMMVGALVFLGCPLRLWERLGAGDLNAVVGLAGMAAGVGLGTLLLRHRFDPPVAEPQAAAEGLVFPLLTVGLLALFVLQATGVLPELLKTSAKGPGAMYPGTPTPPKWAIGVPLGVGAVIALAAGALVGGLSQYGRFCSVSGLRHLILARNGALLGSVAALAAVYGVGTAVLGDWKLGFSGQPVAHTVHLWNGGGMVLVGLCGALISGCPLRQLVRAGSGDGDAVLATVGLVVGAGLAHNLGLAATPKGVPLAAKIAVLVGLVFVAGLGAFQYRRKTAPSS